MNFNGMTKSFKFMIDWVRENQCKNGMNLPPTTPRTAPPSAQPNNQKIHGITIKLHNCFDCPLSSKTDIPFCSVNTITFSSGIPTDYKMCKIDRIILVE